MNKDKIELMSLQMLIKLTRRWREQKMGMRRMRLNAKSHEIPFIIIINYYY